MGRFFGKRWKIDGVTAGPISRHYPANGRYSVIFERDDAFLEQIEKINWAKPTIQRLSEDANEQGLPEGYGFKVVDIRKYDNSGPSLHGGVADGQPVSRRCDTVSGTDRRAGERCR